MRARHRAARIPGLAALSLAAVGAALSGFRPQAPTVDFTEVEVRRLLQHSPLGPPPADPTNALADDPRAAALGQRLFFDPRLSATGAIACATCHQPGKGLADGQPLAQGLGQLTRHVPALWNVAWQRWYFWDGRVDTLWGQVFQPLEHPLEMGSSRTALARLIASDERSRTEYEALLGPLPEELDAGSLPEHARPVPDEPGHPHARAWEALDPSRRAAIERVAVNAAKAIAAYQRGLSSRRSAFDVFAEGLRENDPAKLAALSPSAQRGARLFVGKAGCRVCHSGPTFSDGEFHDIGLGPLGGGRRVDSGRFAGLERLLADPFNSASSHSDAPGGEKAEALGRLARGPQTWGEFKTPTLRNVALTAPYMHQGQLASLEAVLRYYSTLEGSLPSGHHQETILVPLGLSAGEAADLQAFLESLTDQAIDPALLAPP